MGVRQLENAPGTPHHRTRSAVDETPRGRALLDVLWSDWRLGVLAAVALAAGFGLLSAWLTPRGPITTSEALISMATALAVGLGAGLVMGTRWSILVTPVVFAVVFEIARIGMVGPTVDAINLGSFYGILAFAIGRGVHGLLVLLPLALGSVYGVRLASRLGNPTSPTMGGIGWTFTALGTLVLAAVAFFIVLPASTSPIVGADGEPLESSVAELTTVTIGGHDQSMMIRGRSVDNPVLLYLTGGPGGTDLGAMRRDVTLEDDFTVVVWDQRGAGKSYATLDPTDTFTLEQFVADTIDVTNYLRDRFDEERIYLVGQSWGSTLGVMAVQQDPELFHAFVGVGQMVSQRETDIMFWDDTLAWAEETGDTDLARVLRSNGPPPYENINLYEPVVSHEHDWNPYPGLDLGNEMPAILFVPEYTWMDRINAFRGFLDTNATLYPQLQGVDFRQDVTALDIPFYMVVGEHEARGRAEIASEWFDILDAPSKEEFILQDSGHRAHFDRPGDFADVMAHVLEQSSSSPSTGDTTP